MASEIECSSDDSLLDQDATTEVITSNRPKRDRRRPKKLEDAEEDNLSPDLRSGMNKPTIYTIACFVASMSVCICRLKCPFFKCSYGTGEMLPNQQGVSSGCVRVGKKG